MGSVSLLEFRRDAEGVIRRVTHGQSLVLTYRGKPVLRLEPLAAQRPPPDDPFYKIPELAEPGQSLTNEEIDQIIYEP